MRAECFEHCACDRVFFGLLGLLAALGLVCLFCVGARCRSFARAWIAWLLPHSTLPVVALSLMLPASAYAEHFSHSSVMPLVCRICDDRSIVERLAARNDDDEAR